MVMVMVMLMVMVMVCLVCDIKAVTPYVLNGFAGKMPPPWSSTVLWRPSSSDTSRSVRNHPAHCRRQYTVP